MPSHLEVVAAEALDSRRRAEIVQLCEETYRESFSRLFDDFRSSSHVLARDQGGTLVSHAMWVTRWLQPHGQRPLRAAYVEAVATRPHRQRRGFGSAVMERLVAAVCEDPAWELIALSPAVPEFYRRRGWESWLGPLGIRRGEAIEMTPADELVMIHRTPRTPAVLVTTSLLTAEWRVGELW